MEWRQLNFYDRYKNIYCDCGGIISMRDKENFTCLRCGKVHEIENCDWLSKDNKTGWLYPMLETQVAEKKIKRKQFSKEERIAVYKKYDGHCAYCGCEMEYKDMQVDHFHPVYVSEWNREDVDNSFENLMPACRSCNFYKSTYSLETFRELIQEIPQKLMKVFIYKIGLKYGIIEVKETPIVFYFEKCSGYKRVEEEQVYDEDWSY
jgi:hypothetical protein